MKNEKQEVCITFSDPSESVFVSLSGEASLTQDKTLLDKYWSKGVAARFPHGKESEEMAILAVTIYEGEHCNADDSKLVQLFEMTKDQLLGESPTIEKNANF